MNPFKKSLLLYVVLLSLNTITPAAQAQLNVFEVQDISVSTLVINTNFPQSAAIVLYTPFTNLQLQSSINLLDTRLDTQREEYILTTQPNKEHIVTLQYPGFEPYDLRVPPIEAGQTRAFTIQPADTLFSGFLTIEPTPTDASVEVGGLSFGEGTLELYLPEGTYPVRISKKGYEPVDITAQVSSEQPDIQRRSLRPTRQPVTVQSNIEGALIFMNGTEVGRTPLTDFMVDQGLVEIRVERIGYTQFEQVIDIRNDQPNQVVATLERVIQLLPSSRPNVQNESLSITNDTLRIQYELSPERRLYKVDVFMLGQNNLPIEVSGFLGDIGKGQNPGAQRTIYWPIPDAFPLKGLKVQVRASPYMNPLWYVAGGIGISGGIAVGLLMGGGGSGNDDSVVGTPIGRPPQP